MNLSKIFTYFVYHFLTKYVRRNHFGEIIFDAIILTKFFRWKYLKQVFQMKICWQHIWRGVWSNNVDENMSTKYFGRKYLTNKYAGNILTTNIYDENIWQHISDEDNSPKIYMTNILSTNYYRRKYSDAISWREDVDAILPTKIFWRNIYDGNIANEMFLTQIIVDQIFPMTMLLIKCLWQEYCWRNISGENIVDQTFLTDIWY